MLRATGKGMRNSRFNDMLIDVNAVTTGGLSGCAIEYHKAGPIYFIGGTFEGPIGLGQNCICYSAGARFLNRKQPMRGFVREGEQLPEDSFYKLTDEAVTIPFAAGRAGVWSVEPTRTSALCPCPARLACACLR